MKLIAAFAMAAVAMAAPLPEATSTDFAAWKAAHGKTYTGEEHDRRASVFADNVAFIQSENTKGHGYTLGVGPFADMTNDEFAATMTTPFERTTPRNEVYLPTLSKMHGDADDSVDWRTKGAVTPVKNQAKCGSCWSFSTTGSIEGANAIVGNSLISLSEQQLVDCATKYGNKGCQGGSMDSAMMYVKANGGLDTEADYQYTAADGQCDLAKEGQHAATISGHKDVPQNNPTQLAAAVAKGPVSIAIEADKPAFQHYQSGVLDSTACGTKLDHGVLIVGYGTDSASGEDYWTVKNSWGPTWGEQGYIRIEKGDSSAKGVCGINMQPVYPTATKGPPPAPSPGPSPGPSPPPGPGGQCAVPAAERHSCGFLLSKMACEQKGCCYDNSILFAAHCYHPGDGPTPPSPPPGPTPPAPPGEGHYEKPSPSCHTGEDPIQIQGLQGSFCSPECSGSTSCPAAPAGSTAVPQCVLESQGSSSPTNCALICGGGGAHGGTCPTGATCQQIQNTGICLYP